MVRRRATHHYYPKDVRAGAWFYEASDRMGVDEGGSVGLLAEAYVRDRSSACELPQDLCRFRRFYGTRARPHARPSSPCPGPFPM